MLVWNATTIAPMHHLLNPLRWPPPFTCQLSIYIKVLWFQLRCYIFSVIVLFWIYSYITLSPPQYNWWQDFCHPLPTSSLSHFLCPFLFEGSLIFLVSRTAGKTDSWRLNKYFYLLWVKDVSDNFSKHVKLHTNQNKANICVIHESSLNI